MSTTYLTIGKLFVKIRPTVPDGFAVDIWESDDFLRPKNRKLLVALTGSESQKIVAAIVKLIGSDVTHKPPQPQPVPTLGFVELVSNLCDWVENTQMGQFRDKTKEVRQALSRHKEREKLVSDIMRQWRDNCYWQLESALKALIDFDKGAV